MNRYFDLQGKEVTLEQWLQSANDYMKAHPELHEPETAFVRVLPSMRYYSHVRRVTLIAEKQPTIEVDDRSST